MKLNIDLPDWANKGQLISIFAGTEVVAYKYPDKPMMVKTGRCSHCGACCKDWDKTGWPVENGVCKFLVENQCTAQLDKPFICCLTPLEPYNKDCTIKWEPII